MQQDTLALPYSSIENTTHTDGAFDCIRDVNEAFDLRVDPTFFELQEKLQGMALQLTHRDLRSGSTQSDLGKLLFMAAGREELDWTPFTESHAKVWAELGKPALAALWREYGELARRIPLQWHGPDAGRDGCAFADPDAARAALTDLNLRVQQAFDQSDIGEHTLSTYLLDKWNVRGVSEEAFNDYWAQRVMASKIYQTSGEKLGYRYPPHPMTKVSMCLSKAHIAQLEAHGYRPQFLFMDRSYREEGTTGRGKRAKTIYAKTAKGPIRIRRTNKNLMACEADDLRVETIDRQPLFKVSGKAGAERDLVAFWGN